MDKHKELVRKIAEACIDELYGSHNTKNLTALCKRQHKRDTERYNKINPEVMSQDEVQKQLHKSVTEFGTREYAENHKIPLNCSVQEKVQRIRECVGLIMDVCPIMPVGQENPAKKEADKKKKKESSEK